MDEEEIEEMRRAIKGVQRCDSVYIESVAVKEDCFGQIVWDVKVGVFDLLGHPTASRCYVWSHESGEGKRRLFAVLQSRLVDSPNAAVRVAIASEYRRRFFRDGPSAPPWPG